MLLIVVGLAVLGQAAEDRAGFHIVAVDDQVVALGVGPERRLLVQVRYAVDAVGFVRRVHNRKIQIGAVDGDPADKVAVLVAQGSKPGTVGVDIFPCRGRGRRGIDHRLQVGKLALGLAVIEEPLDQQAAADEENRGENDHREGVQQITALFFALRGLAPAIVLVVVLVVEGRRFLRRNLRQIGDCIGCLYLNGRGLRQRCIAAVNLCHDGFSCKTILSLLYDLRGKKTREISHKNL